MDWEGDAEEALKALQDAAPTLMNDVPQLKALSGFLPLLGITLSAVTTVQNATGGTTAEAVQAVAQTLTPGMDSSGALSVAATPSDPGAAVSAVTAAVSGATT